MLPQLINCLLKNGYNNALLQVKDNYLTIENDESLLFFKLPWSEDQAPIKLSFFETNDLLNIQSIQFENSKIYLYAAEYEYILEPTSHRDFISIPKIKPITPYIYLDHIKDFIMDSTSYYSLNLKNYCKTCPQVKYTHIEGDFSLISASTCVYPAEEITDMRLVLGVKTKSSNSYMFLEVNEFLHFVIPITIFVEDSYE